MVHGFKANIDDGRENFLVCNTGRSRFHAGPKIADSEVIGGVAAARLSVVGLCARLRRKYRRV